MLICISYNLSSVQSVFSLLTWFLLAVIQVPLPTKTVLMDVAKSPEIQEQAVAPVKVSKRRTHMHTHKHTHMCDTLTHERRTCIHIQTHAQCTCLKDDCRALHLVAPTSIAGSRWDHLCIKIFGSWSESVCLSEKEGRPVQYLLCWTYA